MKELKIWFSDMWGYENYQFNPHNNYFSTLLSFRYTIILDPIDPDLLVYSCFGDAHKQYNCKKIFFTGENTCPPGINRTIYPNYNECDFSLSFFPDSSKNKYFPLWALFVNWFGKNNPKPLPSNPTFLVEPELLLAGEKRLNSTRNIFSAKKFCAFINNNPIEDRIILFNKLCDRIKVDSFGKLLNNTGYYLRGTEEDKHKLITKYKTTIAYENSNRFGYNTEKIIQPYAAYCIPIYSGGLDQNIFNSASMFYIDDYRNVDAMVDDVIAHSNSETKWLKKSSEPLFCKNEFPQSLLPLNMLDWFHEILH